MRAGGRKPAKGTPSDDYFEAVMEAAARRPSGKAEKEEPRGSLLQRWQLLVQALCDEELSKGDCTVLAVIASHAGKEGEAWPGVNRIASLGGVHKTTVIRSVDRLAARGYLDVSRKQGMSNRYRLASTGRMGATGTGSTGATSDGETPVASTQPTGRTGATGLVAPALPDLSHPRYPNSAFELASKNSKKNSVACGADVSFEEEQEQLAARREAAKQQAEADAQEKEQQRTEGIRSEYLRVRESNPKLAKDFEATYPRELADLLPILPSGMRKLVP